MEGFYKLICTDFVDVDFVNGVCLDNTVPRMSLKDMVI